MIPTPTFHLRVPPTGPTVTALAENDTLLWNDAAQQWQTGPVPPVAPTIVGFTYVVRDRADLVDIVEPVGGEFNLPDGSYSILGNITLLSGEYLSIGDAGIVTLQGTGAAQVIGPADSPDAVLRVKSFSFVTIRNLDLASNTSGQPALRLDDSCSVSMINSAAYNFSANSDGVEILGSDAFLRMSAGSYVYGSLSAVSQVGGILFANAGYFATEGGAGGACVRQTGAPLSKRVFITDSFFETVGSNPILRQNSANGSMSVSNSEMVIRAGAAVTQLAVVDLARSLQLSNNTFLNQAGGTRTVLSVAGNADSIQLSQNRAEAFNRTCAYSSGVVASAEFSGNRQNSGADFISWAAANAPTDGLILTSNASNSAGFATGFTAASARVNMKANTRAGALVSETAIVP